MKKISIIVPVYNVELYIDECINSIIQQTYENIEIIIIDDGSKDKSGEICDRFSELDSRVKVIHTTNNGLSAARNEGIKNSSGEYIMFIDGDDFIRKGCINEIAKIINEEDNIDIITGRMIKYYNKDNEIVDNFRFDESKFINKNGIEILTYFFKEIPSIIWSACMSIYRREFLIKNNFYFTEGITSEDLDLVPQIYMKACKVRCYNNPFYYYRQLRPNSIVNTVNSKRFYDIVLIIKKYLKIIEEREFSNSFKIYFLKELANIYARYVAILGYVPKEDRQDVLIKIKTIKNILEYANGIRGKYIFYSTKYLGFKMSYSIYKIIKESNLIVAKFKL